MPVNIQPLRPYMTFIDKDGSLTKDAYDFLYSLYQRVGGSLDSINASTLETHTWESPGPIGALSPNSGVFTSFQANQIVADTPGLKHLRVATGSIAAGADGTTTCAWSTAFTDLAYTVVAAVNAVNLTLVRIGNITTGNVEVTLHNPSASPESGIIHLIAMHD